MPLANILTPSTSGGIYMVSIPQERNTTCHAQHPHAIIPLVSEPLTKYQVNLEVNMPDNITGTSAISEIYAKLQDVTTEVAALAEQDAVPLQNISIEQTRKEIEQLFKETKSEKLYYSDLAEQLHLDLKLVVEACDLLIEQGVLQFAD
mgnify:CR=1 FL=1